MRAASRGHRGAAAESARRKGRRGNCQRCVDFSPPRKGCVSNALRTEAALDSQSRSHITRKLRNRLGTSPPPTPLASHPNGVPNGTGSTRPGPVTNPHSLSVDELSSPFPLPLTATSLPNMAGGNVGSNGGRRRPKGGGFQVQAVGGLGKSGASLIGCN
jgi:hypothetical protein